MKSMMKDAVILFAITLIAGLLLGVVYEVTKEPIEIQQAKRKNEACKPDAGNRHYSDFTDSAGGKSSCLTVSRFFRLFQL